DRSDAAFGDQLHAGPRARVHGLQVVDGLREVFDRVDVVVGRRRNEGDAGDGVPQPRDQLRDLVSWELAALAGLGALSHLALELEGVGEVLGRDAEARRGDLLGLVVGRVAVATAAVPDRVLAALPGVRAPTHA